MASPAAAPGVATRKGQAVDQSAVAVDEENRCAIGRPVLRIIDIPVGQEHLVARSFRSPFDASCLTASLNTSSRPSDDQTASASWPNVSLIGIPVAASSNHSPDPRPRPLQNHTPFVGRQPDGAILCRLADRTEHPALPVVPGRLGVDEPLVYAAADRLPASRWGRLRSYLEAYRPEVGALDSDPIAVPYPTPCLCRPGATPDYSDSVRRMKSARSETPTLGRMMTS